MDREEAARTRSRSGALIAQSAQLLADARETIARTRTRLAETRWTTESTFELAAELLEVRISTV
jgi:hypothetical protein